jgi:hypothetical protein
VLSRVLLLADFYFASQYPVIDLLDPLEFFLDVLPEAVTDFAVMTLDNDVHGNLHRSATLLRLRTPVTTARKPETTTPAVRPGEPGGKESG